MSTDPFPGPSGLDFVGKFKKNAPLGNARFIRKQCKFPPLRLPSHLREASAVKMSATQPPTSFPLLALRSLFKPENYDGSDLGEFGENVVHLRLGESSQCQGPQVSRFAQGER